MCHLKTFNIYSTYIYKLYIQTAPCLNTIITISADRQGSYCSSSAEILIIGCLTSGHHCNK